MTTFRRPARSQVCISVVANNGIKRVTFQSDGATQPEQTHLNWELQHGEQIKEGESYRIVILPDRH